MLPVKSKLLPTVSRFFEDDWNSLFNWNDRHHLDRGSIMPSVNIKESRDQFTVEVAAPGMKKDDFNIELDKNILTIKSETKHETSDEGNDSKYARREFSYQSFQRSFNLDQRVVDDAKIKASYKDGILTIHLPKKEEAKNNFARKINIS